MRLLFLTLFYAGGAVVGSGARKGWPGCGHLVP